MSITLLLSRFSDDPAAADQLMSRIYPQLRRMAATYLRRELSDLSLCSTELVHEAVIRLNGLHGAWKNRAHFFGAASNAMRRTLIDKSRARKASKRAGLKIYLDDMQIELDDMKIDPRESPDPFGVYGALEQLKQVSPEVGRVAELKLEGRTIKEIADTLCISEGAVRQKWNFGQAWLQKELA